MANEELPFEKAFREIREAKSESSKLATNGGRWWHAFVNVWREDLNRISQENSAELQRLYPVSFSQATTNKGAVWETKLSIGLHKIRDINDEDEPIQNIPKLVFEMNKDGNAHYSADGLSGFENGKIPLDDQDYYNKLVEVLARYVSAAVRSTIK